VADFQCPREKGNEDLAGNPPRGFVASGSMLLQYFVELKKIAGK